MLRCVWKIHLCGQSHGQSARHTLLGSAQHGHLCLSSSVCLSVFSLSLSLSVLALLCAASVCPLCRRPVNWAIRMVPSPSAIRPTILSTSRISSSRIRRSRRDRLAWGHRAEQAPFLRDPRTKQTVAAVARARRRLASLSPLHSTLTLPLVLSSFLFIFFESDARGPFSSLLARANSLPPLLLRSSSPLHSLPSERRSSVLLRRSLFISLADG